MMSNLEGELQLGKVKAALLVFQGSLCVQVGSLGGQLMSGARGDHVELFVAGS